MLVAQTLGFTALLSPCKSPRLLQSGEVRCFQPKLGRVLAGRVLEVIKGGISR